MTTTERYLQHPCRTCGANIGDPCHPTGTRPAEDSWWHDYRREHPHPSRDMGTHHANPHIPNLEG